MELLLLLIISGTGNICKGTNITSSDIALYASAIGIKREWADGEMPNWYTRLVKNSGNRALNITKQVGDKQFCLWMGDINMVLSRNKYQHFLPNILINSFTKCDGISPIQLEKIDAGGHDPLSKNLSDIENTILILNKGDELREKYKKDYCILIEFTYDSIYKNQYIK